MIKHFKRLFIDQMLQNKILIIYIPLILSPIILLSYVSVSFFAGIISNNASENESNNLLLIISQVESMLSAAEACADTNTIALNRDIFNVQSDSQSLSNLALRNSIQNQLSLSYTLFDGIDSIIFIDRNDAVYFASGKKLLISDNDTAQTDEIGEMLDKIQDNHCRNFFFPIARRNYLTTTDKPAVLTLGKHIIDINTGKKLGELIINIDEQTLASSYLYAQENRKIKHYIIDSKGKIISSSEKEDLFRSINSDELFKNILAYDLFSQIVTINDEKILMSSAGFNKMDWKIVSEIPVSELTGDISKVNIFIAAVSFICLMLCLASARVLSRLVTKPLSHLVSAMGIIDEENLGELLISESKDEVGTLTSGFNTMKARINRLLLSVREEQSQKREYELALIQMQIKPHILYNTLDVIYSLVKMKKHEEALLAVKSLAAFYRGALSKGNEIITIEQELKTLEAYLAIQKIRYSDVFDYVIQVDSEIMHYAIVKLTLQPLVENAIYHGLKLKGSPGMITVDVQKKADHIYICVIDNGVGMPEDVSKNILLPQKAGKSGGSFGLRSVNERIKLYFGSGYGLDIESSEGIGTRMTVVIPARSEKGWEK